MPKKNIRHSTAIRERWKLDIGEVGCLPWGILTWEQELIFQLILYFLWDPWFECSTQMNIRQMLYVNLSDHNFVKTSFLWKDDVPLSHLYALAIKYHNKLKKPEVIDADIANRWGIFIFSRQQFLEYSTCFLFI